MLWLPKTILFNPEEQTLLIVVHGLSIGTPPKRAACLAGFCP